MAVIQSGASTDLQTIDATSKAARATLYDATGNVIAVKDQTALVPGTQSGLLSAGADYKLARLLRASPTGELRVSNETLQLYDAYEGTTADSNKWIETATTMISAQALATGRTLNSAAITTINTNITELSHRQFAKSMRAPRLFRTRLRCPNFGLTNSQIEWGFIDTSGATAAQANGAFFRKDTTGNLVPFLSAGSAEIPGTAMTAPATTDYAIFEILWEDDRATFSVTSAAGVLISQQTVVLAATTTRLTQTTHTPAGYRIAIFGSAPGVAPQLLITASAVYAMDAEQPKFWDAIQSGMNYNSLTSPTAYTQLAQYANSADPAAAALSNTAASYTTLGGLWIGPTPTPAAAATDFVLFGWQNPSPYTFFFRGIVIEAKNMGIAIATTNTMLQWGIGFNSSAVSLATAAPYAYMRVSLGLHTWIIADGVNVAPREGKIVWQPITPIAVQPGRFVAVIFKVITGTATASGFLRGHVAIDGYFE